MSLAEEQIRLLNALLADGPVPQGFDADRLRTQHDALIAKRLGLLRMAYPELVEQAGEQFAEYARQHPGRPPGGTNADAQRLAEWLAERTPKPPKRRWLRAR